MLEKLLDFITSEKVEAARLPAIILIVGLLIIFLSDKVPDAVSEKGVISVVGFIAVFISIILVLFSALDRVFNIRTMEGVFDGVFSGLISSFIVAAAIFAPLDSFSESNFYIYRVSIVISYGMLYGGLLGLFIAFFQPGSQLDVKRHFTIAILTFGLLCFFLSGYLQSRMPVLPSDGIRLGHLYLIFMLYIFIYIALYFKSFKVIGIVRPILYYVISSGSILLILLLGNLKFMFPDYEIRKYTSIFNMGLYANDKVSAYLFASSILIYAMYAVINIIYSIRKIRSNSRIIKIESEAM